MAIVEEGRRRDAPRACAVKLEHGLDKLVVAGCSDSD